MRAECAPHETRKMKIAWVLALGAWAAECGGAVAQQQLRFATGESLDEILEHETHRLETVELETSDAAETWSKTYYQLLISCSLGTLQLDQVVEKQLVDTASACASGPQSSRSIGFFTTAKEAQQILSSIIYQPDEDYHRSWTGVTHPLCTAGNDGHATVCMQLIPVRGDIQQPSKGACIAVEPGDYSGSGSLHEKKISVASVNDPPTVEREFKVPLSGGSCVGLTGFKLGDTEASPILILQLSVNGALRLNRRSALQIGIHAMGGESKMGLSSPFRDPFEFPELLLTRDGLEEKNCRDNIAFRVLIQAKHDFFTLASGLATMTSADAQRTLVLEGRIRDLNLALNTVKFQFEIRRDSPITASVEIEVEANGGHEGTAPFLGSSAYLQLRFVGDTRPPEVLAKDAMLAFEDADVLIGGAVNLEAFEDLAANAIVSINAHNGVLYAAADGVEMDASSEQRIISNDIRHLQSVMSTLRYSPTPDFNGIEEIDFTMESQKSTLYIYVQAQNDPPSMAVNSEEATDWFTYPRMFLPSFRVDDPDENDLLSVEIRADNGSWLVDQMATSTFDGVTVELNASSSSVRFTSRSGKLNTIFQQRLVEFVPKVCTINSTTQLSCSAEVEVCIDDGTAGACQELTLPEQERFYRIVVLDSAKYMNVSAGSYLNLSQVFEIHQRFDVMNELFLRVRVSSGDIHIDKLNCGELRDVVGLEALQPSDRVRRIQTIHAPDAECLNRALTSVQLRNTDRAKSIVVQLELVSDERHLLANGSASVSVTSNLVPMRIRAVRKNADLWVVRPGTYANLTSLVAASVVADPAVSPADESAGEIALELNVSCSGCHWIYETFVRRVSYEFAQVPSSNLRFLGLSKSLNEVLATLKLTINSTSSAEAEALTFELAPMRPRSSQVMESGWSDSTEISIPCAVRLPDLIDVEAVQRMRSDSVTEYHPLSELQEIKLSLRNESLIMQVKEGEVQAVGDLLAVSGNPEDARWFRIKMRVLHGRLSIPTNVCCVDIRETDQELDVVGSALALKKALAAAEFQSQDPYTGKDELRVTIDHFDSPSEATASFNVPIHVIAINHMPTISHRQISSSDSFSEEEIVLDDIDMKTLEVPSTPLRVRLSSMDGTFFLDEKVKQRVSVLEIQEGGSGYSNFTFEAPLPVANALLARVLYATSNMEVNCGEISVAVDDQGHGVDTWGPKQTSVTWVVRDCESYQLKPNEEAAEAEVREDMLTEADVFASIAENNGVAVKKTLAPSRSKYLIDATSSHTVPLIEGSMEGPIMSTQSWEVVTLAFADPVILPQVDVPVISVPAALEDPFHYMSDYLSILRLECLPFVCDEDSPTVLNGFSVRSVDLSGRQLLTKDLLVLSASVSHGVLSLGDTLRANCIAGFVGNQSWKHVSFKATVDCINRVLSATTYVGDPNFSGADQLTVRVEYVREGGMEAAFDEVVVPIVIAELNDAPYVEIASVYYEAEEDIPLLIEDLRLQDPDAAQDELLRVTLETNYGKLALLRTEGVELTSETSINNGEGGSRLTLEGSLRNLNATMASIVYTSARDWNSLQYRPDGGMNGFDTITIHATDIAPFNASSTSILFLYVDPQPDPVVIDIPSNAPTSIYVSDLPGTMRGDEDTWMSISGLAFSSADDTSRATLVASLSVQHGMLSLSKLGGITFLEGTADQGQTIKLMGSFASVNACVTGLRYLPNKDFYGMDLFAVTASAVDEYTQQETPPASIDVAITVNAVNDPPVWNIGSSAVREIYQGRAASLAGISFTDVDVAVLDCTTASCEMDLVLEASDGLVTRSDQSSSLFSNDLTPKTAAYVVLSGTPDKLNTMVSEMLFELAEPGYYRADSPNRTDIKLQLTVDDRGTFGKGGPQISTTTVVFSPAVWSHYEVSIVAPEGVLALDEDAAFVFDGDLHLSDLDSARPFRSLLELTVSCSNGAFALSGKVGGIQVVRNDSDVDGVVVIRGYFSQLNAGLNGSSYIPAANWYGSEQLSLSLMELDSPDKSRRAVDASIFLFVAPACDEPIWVSLVTEPKTMEEDGYLLIDTLSLTSPDLDNDQREVEVTIGVKHGGVMLSMVRGLLIQHSTYSASEDRLVTQHIPPGHSFSSSRLFFKDLAFRGRVSDANAALKGMMFKPWPDYNSNGWHADEIELGATSSCGGTGSGTNSSSFTTIAVAVNAVNDPPVLLSQHFHAIPSQFSLHSLEVASRHSLIEAVEDSPLALESTELFDADADPRGDDLRLLVNISCIHCTVTSEHLSQSSEFPPGDDLIVVARNWENKEGVQLVVHGDVLSLNKGLMNHLMFRGAENFNGLAFVVIKVSDFGNYGEGGERHSAFVLGVQVKPASDAPQIHLPKYQSQETALQLDEGASVIIQGAPALSIVSAPARQQTAEWSVMSANLLANDASTRLRSLHEFSGPEGLVASFVVPHNGGFLFRGHDTNCGEELWRSDGTAVGTVLLKDIFPGYEGSRPSYLTPFSKDNRVYFAAKGPHLSWMMKEDYQDACQSSRPSSFDANVFFTVAKHNIWDPEETYDCPVGFRWMSTSEAHEIFVGTIALEGHSDEPLTYFDQCGWRGYEWGGQTRKYFRFSDSKTTGAFKHAGFRDSYRVDTGFQTDVFAGIVCYREDSAYQATWGSQLWATDGTSEGTQRIARISTDADGSNPSHFVELDSRLYFQASSPDFGSELWSTDGSRVATYVVADIEFGSRSSEPRFLTAFDSRIFFSARTLAYGREVWFSDGDSRFKFTGDGHATVGTGLLLDICVGEKSSSPQHFAVLVPTTGSARLLFQADDCVHGPELWLTDGTRAGTALVLDINKGSVGSHPAYLTAYAGEVYFQADDGVHGAELWATDGTPSGTVMLVDIAPGVLGSAPSFFTVLDSVNIPSGTLVFAAQAERDRLTEFWRSDGTSSGTAKLFPQSREVVELSIDSLNLQLAGHKFVSIASQPDAFFYLGRKRDQGIDFQSEAASRIDVAHAEDVARTRSITLQDVDSAQQEGELTLSLNCSKGWLSLRRQCDGVAATGAVKAPDSNQAAALTLKGSLDALNCAVEQVTYHSKPHANGWDEIRVTLSQGVAAVPGEMNSATSAVDEPGRDGSFSVSKRMLVEIRAVNDPPSITMAAVYYAPPREWVGLTQIEVTDPDSGDGILYVSIAVRSGKLRATLPRNGNQGGSTPTALHAASDGDSSQMLEFAATAEQTKVLFEGLEYMCDDRDGCFNSQRDYVTVQVDDNGFTGSRGPQVRTKTAEVIVVVA